MNAPGEHNDENTSVSQLRQVVSQFVAERDWSRFHAPKNLAMALSIEAAELMELFQWIDVDVSRDIDQLGNRQAVEEEVADVLCYTLALANEMKIDLASALQKKMVKNRLKYPADEFRGRYGPQDPGPAESSTG